MSIVADMLLTLADLDAKLEATTDPDRRASLVDMRRRVVAALHEMTRTPRAVDPPGCVWRRHKVPGGVLPPRARREAR